MKLVDSQYQKMSYHGSFLEHRYGDKTYILQDPYLLSLLAKLGQPETCQPVLDHLLEKLYQALLREAINVVFPRSIQTIATRMQSQHPDEGYYQGGVIDPNCSVVSIDLARAGILPSAVCFRELNYLLPPEQVRQDHFVMNRRVNEQGQVVGVDCSGSKVGGGIEKKILLLPDPMGATGSTICHALNYYQENIKGTAAEVIALHLIITPEYLKKVRKECPQLRIFALRLDRGLSSEKVLQSIPGTFWEKEQGLNTLDYIVPGAGGVGEVLNNAYV